MIDGGASSDKEVARAVRRYAPWLAVALLILLWLSYRSTHAIAALTLSEKAGAIGFVGAIGIVLGVWGIGLSIGGFTITWMQLRRTASASDAVKAALRRIKEDYDSFDLITEIRTAKGYAEYAQSHVAQRRWEDALLSFNNIRVSLVKMIAVQGGMSDQNLDQAKNYLATTVDTCAAIDRLMKLEPDTIEAEVLSANLRDLEGFLITVEYNLKGAIRG